MEPAEIVLTLAILVAPLLLGFLAGYKARPWWWAALAAVVIFLLAAIAPTPEPGEPRFASGDIGFLAVVSLIVAGLAWLGAFIGRRVAARSNPRLR